VLEEDPLGGVVNQEPGGTEPTPEPPPVAIDPGIARIAWAQRAARIARQQWCERCFPDLGSGCAVHPYSLPRPGP